MSDGKPIADAEIEFPEGSLEIVTDWLESDDGSVGACLRCGVRFYSQSDCDNHRCRQD
jgi:hypothetical protein